MVKESCGRASARLAPSMAVPVSYASALRHTAVDAALTLPHHNGGTEGVNYKTKLIKRQMYGRASFPLLRHRILLG